MGKFVALTQRNDSQVIVSYGKGLISVIDFLSEETRLLPLTLGNGPVKCLQINPEINDVLALSFSDRLVIHNLSNPTKRDSVPAHLVI